MGLGSGEDAKKQNFQAGHHGGQLGFPIERILAILIYQSPLCFLPSLESIGLSVHKKKLKIDPSWISDQNNFFLSIYDLKFTPKLPKPVQVNWRKIDFQDDCLGGHLGFLIGTILDIFDL